MYMPSDYRYFFNVKFIVDHLIHLHRMVVTAHVACPVGRGTCTPRVRHARGIHIKNVRSLNDPNVYWFHVCFN